MNRENLKLSFAARYYFHLCDKLIGKFNADEKYLEQNINSINTSKRLYQVHLASCCFRLSALIEKKGTTHKMAYGYLKDLKTKNEHFHEYLPFLVRDTVSHKEQTGHPMFEARKHELENITSNKVHTIIKEAITRTCLREPKSSTTSENFL